MPSKTIRQLRGEGVSDEDIRAGLEHQRAQRMAGVPVLSLAQIVGAANRRSSAMSAGSLHKRSQSVRDLARIGQLEFDFFEGNVSASFQYVDTVTERLRGSGRTLAQQLQAQAVLWQICRHLGWESYECSKTAAELSDITGIGTTKMPNVLNLLEDVGAIQRVKVGRRKVIAVTPEGAYRGRVQNHGAAVNRYKLEVIDGGKSAAD